MRVERRKVSADCSVTREQSALGWGITPGNWDEYPIVRLCWNAWRAKGLPPKDEFAAYQVVVGVTDPLADDGYGP